MSIPSFEQEWSEGGWKRPRIYMLEVRDRKRLDEPPIAWLAVEREEKYRRDPRNNEILEASIRISYERIGSRGSFSSDSKGFFSGGYSRGFSGHPRVSLTSPTVSGGAVFLDLPQLYSQGIGSYMMNEIVNWVSQWPEAVVAPVRLLEGQAHATNKDRRNRFYEQFGLVFDYVDADHREGVSRPMPASSLQPIGTGKANLREVELRSFITEVMTTNERESLELRTLKEAFSDLLEAVKKAHRRPMLWALKQLWARWSTTLTGLVLATLFLRALWNEITKMR